MNLFALLKEVLTEDVIGQIAAQNSEKPEKIQKAFDVLCPSIVGGLIKRVTTESGMKSVFNQSQKIEFDPENLSKIFKNPAELAALKAVGEKDLNTVLPGLKSSVSTMAAQYAGTRNSLTSSLCGISVAIVMSVLKREANKRKLDAESLALYLGEQREGLLTAVPEITDKLIESIGIQHLLQNFTVPRIEQSGSLSGGVEGVSVSQPFLVDMESNRSSINLGPYLKWIGIGVLAIGAVAAGIYFWNAREVNATDSEADLAQTEARTIEESAAKDTTVKKVAPLAAPLTETPMSKYLADSTTAKGKSFKFDNVDFEDNTDKLKATATSSVQALADLMKKHPNSQIKLVGYANDAKLPLTNKTLSIKRVLILKDEFVKAGISYVRVDAEGRGSGVNPRDTTGRKQVPMREVWVKFVLK